jgi:hypothetical protein
MLALDAVSTRRNLAISQPTNPSDPMADSIKVRVKWRGP